jgi:hypothetical protein
VPYSRDISNTPTERTGTMNNYTTLKLTDSQVQALFRAIYLHNESYAGVDDEELEGTVVPGAIRALTQIEAKLAKAGWH